MSARQVQIDMMDIIKNVDVEHIDSLYSDSYFCRIQESIELQDAGKVDLLIDYIKDFRMGVAYIKITSFDSYSFQLYLEDSSCQKSSKGTFVKTASAETVFWLPGRVFTRDYFEDGNIKKEQQIETSVSDDNGFFMNIPVQEKQVVEFPVVFVKGQADEFIEQIVFTDPEEEKLTRLDKLFKFSQPDDVWDYLVAGNVFRLAAYIHDVNCELRWPCQQTANSLYSYLVHLHECTGKSLYIFLSDLVAYSVMINLSVQGRWKHGIWAPEIMETHTRFQVSGICLLVSYYERTNRQVFLDKAQTAMNYIISISDNMSGQGIWFVHDSLEQQENWDNYRYKNDLDSTAFGKSRYNSLCLNTHIWTLLGLYELKKASGDERYDTYLSQGVDTLKKVLEARPAEMMYRIAYRLRDILIKSIAKGKSEFIRKNRWRYEKILKRWFLPYFKTRFPRIYMPNGFIERDLTHSQLSDIYHLATLDDLIMMYAYMPDKWLRDVICSSMEYTHKSGFVKYYAKYNPVSNIFLEMLLLCSCMIDESYLKLIPEYLSYFRELDIVASSDILSNMMIISDEIQITADNENLECFTSKHGKKLLAVVVNPCNEQITAKIKLNFLTEQKFRVKTVDSNEKSIDLDQPVQIPARGFIKLIRV